MLYCGCEISSQEIRLVVCYLDKAKKPTLFHTSKTRIKIEDDSDDAQLMACLAEIEEFSDKNNVDRFVIKSRPRKGRMAGGAVTFKLETLLQLNRTTETQFVHPATMTSFFKKNDVDYPDKLPVYLRNAFLTAIYGLTSDK